jgi:hypothetical protein
MSPLSLREPLRPLRSVDIVSCGEGLDYLTADSKDIVRRGCEQVEIV